MIPEQASKFYLLIIEGELDIVPENINTFINVYKTLV